MKKLIVLLISLLYLSTSFGQITSTATGGNWSTPSTWVGGVVPTAATDVVIKGTVVHSNKKDACRNLTISKGAVLTTLSSNMNGWVIKVHGNLINNGTIRDNDAGDWLQLFIYKNVVNNGKWINYGVSLAGDAEQTISGTQPIGCYFFGTQNANNIVAGSDVHFIGTTLLFYKKNQFIIRPGKTVTFSYSDIHKKTTPFMPSDNTVQGVKFTGGGKVLVKGSYNVNEAVFDGVTLNKKPL